MNNETLQKDLMRMRSDISGILDTFLGGRPAEHMPAAEACWAPEVDLLETAEEFVLTAALPGVKKEEIETEVKDDVLTISGSRTCRDSADGNWLRREMPCGRFYRAFRITARVKQDAVKASLKDGILEIRIPKADEAKPNRIQIG